jgi:hypothetical protein
MYMSDCNPTMTKKMHHVQENYHGNEESDTVTDDG